MSKGFVLVLFSHDPVPPPSPVVCIRELQRLFGGTACDIWMMRVHLLITLTTTLGAAPFCYMLGNDSVWRLFILYLT